MRSIEPVTPTPPSNFAAGRADVIAAAGLVLYPALLVLSFLATWTAGRLVLGHWPVPSRDDPKSVGGLVDVLYWTTMLLMMGAPGVFLLSAGAAAAALWRALRLQWILPHLAFAVSVAATWWTGFWLLRWGPVCYVVGWFMD